LINSFGVKCLHEMYDEGAEYYFKKAISYDSKYVDAYINLTLFFVNKNSKISNQIINLDQSMSSKKRYADLNQLKMNTMRSITPYLQKIISLDPYNNSVNQIIESVNNSDQVLSLAIASGD
jgi:hypothetical protein